MNYKEIRIKKGISTYKIQKGGISSNTMKAIEEGGSTYTMKSLEKYKDILGI